MSINVNVSGNPVKIHRGKMVTTDSGYAGNEFQKRRRMRLEQVRQQSKDIAEDVRNRVRKEKNKQLTGVEKQGEKELKKWQARKLLQLQKQYHESLKDIGLAHSEAVAEEESDYEFEARKENYKAIAKDRGDNAFKKLRKEKSSESEYKVSELQKKRLNSALEGTRAKMIANLDKKIKKASTRKKRKVSTDINISSRISSPSETEMSEFLNVSGDSSTSSSDMPRKRILTTSSNLPLTLNSEVISNEPSKSRLSEKRTSDMPRKRILTTTSNLPVTLNAEVISNEPNKSRLSEKLATIHCSSLSDNSYENILYPVDTRISDRIKNRKITSNDHLGYVKSCDTVNYENTLTAVNDHEATLETLPEKESYQKSTFTEGVCLNSEKAPVNTEKAPVNTEKASVNTEKVNISEKPPVALKSVQQSNTGINPSKPQLKDYNANKKNTAPLQNKTKVQHYDHSNRFTKACLHDKERVQRITEEHLEICPSDRSEAELKEKMCKRDKAAQLRGRKAMEKVKTQHDYNEMMKKLPQLQKMERITSINLCKPTFHMSDDRLKQLEMKKQHNMENVYEKLFPSARIITIPSRGDQKTSSSLVSEKDDVPVMNSQGLNVGTWQNDYEPKLAGDVVDNEYNFVKSLAKDYIGEDKNSAKSDIDKKANLQRMLNSVKSHRDKLAKELSTLPKSSNLSKLAGELDSVDDVIELGQKASAGLNIKQRTRSRENMKSESRKETKDSNSNLCSCHSPKRSSKSSKRENFSRYHTVCDSLSSSSSLNGPSEIITKTKSKKERKSSQSERLILQNTSTQTTPTVEKSIKPHSTTDNNQLYKSKPEVTDDLPIKSKTEVSDAVSGKPCECKQPDGETDMCEIVIKISDDKMSEIRVSPINKAKNNIVIKSFKGEQAIEQTNTVDSNLKVDQRCVAEKREKKPGTSWREHFSQNSSSSTCYLSPPNFTSTCVKQPYYTPKPNSSKIKVTGQLANILKEKPQQRNIEDTSTSASYLMQNNKLSEQQVLSYITRLLAMSRKNIEELTVSSVSEISTPSSSIINVQANIHLNQFEDLINNFHFKSDDINTQKNNTVASSSLKSSSQGDATSNTDIQHTSCDMRETTLDDFSTENYPDVLAVYNKLAENCAKKIENLATLIEKVRLEKLDILKNSPTSNASDKENSTKYLDLPLTFKRDDNVKLSRETDQTEGKSQVTDSLSEQEELDHQLQIDYTFAEQLKKMTPAEIKEAYPLSSSDNEPLIDNNQPVDNTEQELLTRLQKLKEPDSKHNSKNTFEINPVLTQTNTDLPFVPLLMDIPRLPKLEMPSVELNSNKNQKTKPPTSKALNAAKRFNIDIVPHELSTIAEAESFLTSRLQKSKSSENKLQLSDQDISLNKANVTDDLKSEDSNVLSESAKTLSNKSLSNVLTELIKVTQDQPLSNQLEIIKHQNNQPHDSSASDMETMEATLKSLGMGWAIATLRKTQEALALSSSSSSSEIRIQNPTDFSISSSDISLRNILLTKQLSSKSATEDSNTSSRFMRELQHEATDKSIDKGSRRTSTPIQSSKTTDKSNAEVSAVKTSTHDNSCENGPFYSLNDSSIRSKTNSR